MVQAERCIRMAVKPKPKRHEATEKQMLSFILNFPLEEYMTIPLRPRTREDHSVLMVCGPRMRHEEKESEEK